VSEVYRDLLVELGTAQVRFLVVGAHALAAHGVPRATQDLDVWIEPTPENAARTWRALARFGAPLEAFKITERDLASPDNVVQIGLPPSRIDLMTTISGVTFAEAWPERMRAVMFGVDVPLIGRDALLRNKRATGRLKDTLDADSLDGA
jgi:hypothetical protein